MVTAATELVVDPYTFRNHHVVIATARKVGNAERCVRRVKDGY